MPKNRDYTGLVRTPSSMAWLIKQRARIQGKIERLEKTHRELPLEIAELQAQLESLDGVFPLHEVKVQPGEIQGKKPFRPRILPWGGMTRAIFEFLRENRDKGPMYTSEIANHIRRVYGLDHSHTRGVDVLDRVSRRMAALAREGHLNRHHSTEIGNREEGRWSLKL